MATLKKPLMKNKQKPGALRTCARMQLHTSQAQKLLRPDPLPDGFQPPGLFRFSNLCQNLCREAAAGDPYADWYLLKTEKAVYQLREEIKSACKRFQGLIDTYGFEVDPASSENPLTVELTMSNPYGFMASYLLADYDQLVRLGLTCENLGILDRGQVYSVLRGIARKLRRIFHLPLEYKFTGVCREDIRHGTKVSERAKSLMGELPKEILNGHRRPRHAPMKKPPPEPRQNMDTDPASVKAGGG
ncbi:MAG TPA: TIGR03761 family integrating conjugative element protein [Rhodobacteraceae bacterium]|nr:TIGR03761 family integrating conjugative element protein [Paracoccaceae bacterium]